MVRLDGHELSMYVSHGKIISTTDQISIHKRMDMHDELHARCN